MATRPSGRVRTSELLPAPVRVQTPAALTSLPTERIVMIQGSRPSYEGECKLKETGLLGSFVFLLEAETLKVIEIQVVSRAGDFPKFPVRPVFVIEGRGPRLRQRLGIGHGDIQLQVVAVHTAKAFRHM